MITNDVEGFREKRQAGDTKDTKGRQATIINRKLLRSDVSLGDFYNAKKDQFLSGVTLWSNEELEKHRQRKYHRPSTNYQFDSGRTEDKRMSLMDIDASLKLSFLGKFIEYTVCLDEAKQNLNLTKSSFVIFFKGIRDSFLVVYDHFLATCW